MKQFSVIPKDFITDFFIICHEEYMDNEIIINFDIVCKWLNVNKSDLKKILLKNFDEKFDYTIEIMKKKRLNSRGATIYENILITPNCLKELCMISQTAKAKEVRNILLKWKN